MRLTDEEFDALVEKESANRYVEGLHDTSSSELYRNTVEASSEIGEALPLQDNLRRTSELEGRTEEVEVAEDMLGGNNEEEESPPEYCHEKAEELQVDNEASFPEERQSQRRKRRDSLHWLNGNIIRPVLNRKTIFFVIWVAFLLYCNVYLGFVKVDKIRKIDHLEKRLRSIRYKQLFVTGEISNIDRREAVWKRLQETGSTLSPAEETPYVIYYDGKTFEKEKSRKK